MQTRRNIQFPFLALLLTILAFTLVLAVSFLDSPPFARLLQGQTPFFSLPVWLRYCLLHPALLKTLARIGFGFSLLGAMLTLFLLLKTEPPNIAYRHLAGIGWAVLLMTGVLAGLALGNVLFPMVRVLVGGNPIGQLKGVLVMLLPSVPAIAALNFVVITIPFSFVKIVARLKASAPARQTSHVLQ